ncbi:hypothetical protein [Georgenia sp. SUBG003]|uniref:hypothetical protein n=1 Tax=Georgenia sp. SUBG003 TaxID=1497974 RepID=UPI003AB86F9B
MPISIPKRRPPEEHQSFVHQAKLVVTLSDDNADSLENRVCLFRQPEMIVETVDHTLEGRKYHAFLLAARRSTRTHHPEGSPRRRLLRFSEPPAHDRWIPGSGRKQASQANLTARYVAPWKKNLQEIDRNVRAALNDLFGATIRWRP